MDAEHSLRKRGMCDIQQELREMQITPMEQSTEIGEENIDWDGDKKKKQATPNTGWKKYVVKEAERRKGMKAEKRGWYEEDVYTEV